tara:strand:+ start:31 stop:252 length:222 start_codon:yes stop_codon:yes gene_type:complete
MIKLKKLLNEKSLGLGIFSAKNKKLSEKVNKSKVNKVFNDVINHMRKSEKKLNEDEWYEMTVQLKKWFNKNVM